MRTILLLLFFLLVESALSAASLKFSKEGTQVSGTARDSRYGKVLGSIAAADQKLEENIRGVSLGGWLVIEPWITPSLFEKVLEEKGQMPKDEYSFCAILGKKRAQEVLEEHWRTFYGEEDFKRIDELGLNLVRIPIGYWAFKTLSDDPYVSGQQKYLKQAIEHARKYDLMVQIDIHGMPGSQNGFDNSGKASGFPEWLEVEKNIELTYEIIELFLEEYGSRRYEDVIHSVEFVNEPFANALDMDKLELFYNYTYVRAKEMEVKALLFYHDGFLPIHSWDWFLNDTDIVMDHHLYEIFSPYHVSLSIEDHLINIKNQGREMASQPHACIVGELSGALTDCTKYINGVHFGARYDGTFPESYYVGSCENQTDFSSWSEQKKNETARFIAYQFETFENCSMGWIFWCFKTEDAIEWDFQKLAHLKMLSLPPRPKTPRPHSSLASGTSTDNRNGKYENSDLHKSETNVASRLEILDSSLFFSDGAFFSKISMVVTIILFFAIF